VYREYDEFGNSLGSVAPRLAQLIPRLASNYDGEVLATVAAIRRVLHGAGCDLHDLASSITPQLPPPQVIDPPDTPQFDVDSAWREVAHWCLDNAQGKISQRQAEFLHSMSRQRSEPSDRQKAWLEAIAIRLSGVSPNA
jgi:hypothetical protein